MKYNATETRIRERLAAHANSPLSNYTLPDEEVMDLIESKEYDNFSPEFQHWLDRQLDIILTVQGQ